MSEPRVLWERAHEYVRSYDLARFVDLFSEDGEMVMPFAPPGVPKRLRGRSAMLAALEPAAARAQAAGRRIVGYSSVVIHETLDPEVVVAEFVLDGVAEATGASYEVPYIQVLRARGGKIVSLRDYMPPQVMQSPDPVR